METPIQILSREIIKPSSPTPHYSRKMKRSYLDQITPPMDIPIVFFYQVNEPSGLTCSNLSQVSQHLKQSLSNILTSFYPLAGTIKDDSFVDCNDAGVEFIEARSQTYLADAIQEYTNDNLLQYAPFDHSEGTLLSVKLTTFGCGGISIGICFSHELGDVASIVAFMNAWAMTCRGETDFVKFNFNLADHFPPRDIPVKKIELLPLDEENLVTKRLVFNEEALMVLKKEATSPLVMNPTKVEVVSAFICKHVIESAKQYRASSTDMILLTSHAVNLRTRMKHLIHSMENVFGNCAMGSTTFYNTKSVDVSYLYQELVSKLRNSIMKINKDYIMRAQTGDCYLKDIHGVSSLPLKEEFIEFCCFSSWCKFPIYEVNYGWGNPTWVCSTGLPIKNSVILMDTKCGKGIEATAYMGKDKLEMLDFHIKLISSNVPDRDQE